MDWSTVSFRISVLAQVFFKLLNIIWRADKMVSWACWHDSQPPALRNCRFSSDRSLYSEYLARTARRILRASRKNHQENPAASSEQPDVVCRIRGEASVSKERWRHVITQSHSRHICEGENLMRTSLTAWQLKLLGTRSRGRFIIKFSVNLQGKNFYLSCSAFHYHTERGTTIWPPSLVLLTGTARRQKLPPGPRSKRH